MRSWVQAQSLPQGKQLQSSELTKSSKKKLNTEFGELLAQVA